MDLKRSVERQFGAAAASYAESFTHRGGPDLDALVAAAELRGDERALDLGCGAGHCAMALAPGLAEIQALDLTPAMLEHTEQLARQRGIHNLQVRRGDAEALPYPDRHFDLVSSRLSAHHYPHPERALREAARVLRPGGRLLLSDSVAPEPAVLDTFLNCIELLRDPSHVRDHSISQWSAMLADAGLEPELIGSWGLELDFDDWVQRMRTPPDAARQIRKLFTEAPVDVRDHFRVEGEPCRSWTISVAVLRARLPEGWPATLQRVRSRSRGRSGVGYAPGCVTAPIHLPARLLPGNSGGARSGGQARAAAGRARRFPAGRGAPARSPSSRE